MGSSLFFLIEKNPGTSGKNQKVEQMMVLNSMVKQACDLNHGSESLQGRHRSPWQAGRQALVTKCVPHFRAGHFGLKSEIINTEVSRAQAELKSESSG